MNEAKIKQAYDIAVERYAEFGIDVEKVLEKLGKVEISMHCWQADDVCGFESSGDLTEFRPQVTIRARLVISTSCVPMY